MKLSVSLPDEDVAILDAYAARTGLRSRSAALQRAIRMLRHPDLEAEYAAAWSEWRETGEEEVWSLTTDDGIDDAAR